ncbi:hypothetical protein ACLOJK_004641 [Asimina triloba]
MDFHGFEAYIGLMLLKTALVGGFSEWQACMCQTPKSCGLSEQIALLLDQSIHRADVARTITTLIVCGLLLVVMAVGNFANTDGLGNSRLVWLEPGMVSSGSFLPTLMLCASINRDWVPLQKNQGSHKISVRMKSKFNIV